MTTTMGQLVTTLMWLPGENCNKTGVGGCIPVDTLNQIKIICNVDEDCS